MVVALAAVAAELWQGFGVGRSEALAALLPLMGETVANVGAVGLPAALTGPYARGDIGTVCKHLAALQSQAPQVLPLYCQLALAGLPLALEKGRLARASWQYSGSTWGARDWSAARCLRTVPTSPRA